MSGNPRILCAFALAFILPVTAAAKTPNPYDIFARAREFWSAQIYPPYLSYDVVVRVDEGAAAKTERYRSQYDATDNAIWVDPVSDYELAHPVRPTGFNFGILFFPIGKPLPPIDFLGVPLLAPNYSFGMAPFVPADPPQARDAAQIVAAVRAQFNDPNPRKGIASPHPSPSGLHVIGSVTAFKRDYRIALLGVANVDGRPCYRLQLSPVREAHTYRLRELWIDERTYATVKLREALNFVNGPGTAVPWTVTFAEIAGAQYVASERADAPMSYRGLVYRHASVAFENIRTRTLPPQRMLVPPTSGLVMDEPPSQ
ncbi:MAG: hypothetical protein ACYDGM_06565 [Vulcanimicrobiaceae bacterium]